MFIKLFISSSYALACLFSGCGKDKEANFTEVAPQAEKIPHEWNAHHHTRIDNYYWLKERDNPRVLAYLNAENQYTADSMSHTTRLQENLYQEMLQRKKQQDETVPIKWGPYFYFTRFEENKAYPIYCRTHIDSKKEEVYLDQNECAVGQSFLALGAKKISPNHNLMVMALDTTGNESFTLKIKDLVSGDMLSENIENCGSEVEWTQDSHSFFYVTYDAALRPFRVFQHILGERADSDRLVYEEKDPLFRISLSKTKDQHSILIQADSVNTSESYVLNAYEIAPSPQLFRKRVEGMKYKIEHHEEHFIILTNKEAQNFKILFVPDKEFTLAWQELLPLPRTSVY